MKGQDERRDEERLLDQLALLLERLEPVPASALDAARAAFRADVSATGRERS